MSVALGKPGESLVKLSERVNRWLFILGILAAGFMVIPTVLDVLSRFILGRSLVGAMEIVEFSMVILVFGGLGYMQDRRAHIRVDLLADKFPDKVRKSLELFEVLAAFVLICLMTWCLYMAGSSKQDSGEVSSMLGIPISAFVYYATFGSAALALALLSCAIRTLGEMLNQRYYIGIIVAIVASLFILCLASIVKQTFLAENLMILGCYGMAFLMILILLGMPIGMAMALVGYIGMVVVYPDIKASFSMLGVTPYTTASNYVYTVVPMFILMGELAMHCGISRDLFNAANVCLGRLPGGLAIATVSGCAGFAAVSGDSMATAVTMASVALPEMRKKHYDPGLACATLAAGGTLGILIPPSTGFIFYSLVTEASIGRLFVAGIIPGLLLSVIFIVNLLLFAKLWPELAPRGEATTLSEKIHAVKGVIAMLALIAFILGGILLGWFSPNEGGAVGAACTLLYAMARHRMTWANLKSSLETTVRVTSSLLLILIGVGLLGFFFASTALPFDLADLVVGLNANRYVVMAAVVVFYIIMGCIMNVIPMILLTLPAIFPSIVGLGYDPVWFGVVVVVLMEMGQITPPVGINVFALSSIATDVPMANIFRKIVPFFLGMLLLIFLLCLFPGLALWLPEQLF